MDNGVTQFFLSTPLHCNASVLVGPEVYLDHSPRILILQGDYLARGPRLLSIKNYVTDIERRPFSASIMSRPFFFIFILFFLLNLPEMLQSLRGHSAAVWLGIANGMQGIHPVMYHL